MPAKNFLRIAEEGTYSHIYNRGIEKRIIFNDEQDYKVFLGFLKDYLTAPADPGSVKKDFTVNGRLFRGVPHQPKNYFNKVELIAYSLMPSHFHLLVHQKTEGSFGNFMRSLCTRYSMYFNKKYQRTGSLFEGPYRSVQIKDVSGLLHLTRYLHRQPSDGYSSYKEYLGVRETSWVKPKVVLDASNGVGGYRNFVEKYELTQKEKELLEGVILENESEHVERRVPEPARNESAEITHLKSDLKPLVRIPELATAVAVFGLLFALGLRNVMVSTAKTQGPAPSPTPSVSGVEDAKDPEPKIILAIKINDGASSVNIRANPTTRSEKIAEAKPGDTFEFVSINSGWYGVRLDDGATGFISARYLEIIEETNN